MRITQLTPVETVSLDRGQFDVLYRQLGPVGADKVVTHALEELAAMLGRLPGLWREGQLAQVEAMARAIASVAQQVGMTRLACVARDVVSLSRDADSPALAAVVGRLVRIGDQSLVAVWDLANLTV